MLIRDDLARFAPRPSDGARAEIWDGYTDALIEHGAALCEEFGIDTALELQHFLAQIAHESGGFTVLWENMNYRAPRIMEIFGVHKHSARVTQAEASKLAGKPQALADRVYGLGNPKKAAELGNTKDGDGYRFRGFGLIQVTGRLAHEKYLQGETTYPAAVRAAFLEWSEEDDNGLCCNDFARADDIKRITRRINGGYNGLADRKEYLAKAKRIWPLFPNAPAPDMTIAEAKQTSAKAKAADVAQKAAIAVATTTAVAEVAEPVAKFTEQITSINGLTSAAVTLSGFVKAHTGMALIIGALCVWWFGRHIIRRVIADFRAGRYQPEPKPVETKP